MAARRAHNPEAVGSSPTPAKVVSGLPSEQKPPVDVVSRPEMKLGNPFCGAKAPEWVAIVFALFLVFLCFSLVIDQLLQKSFVKRA